MSLPVFFLPAWFLVLGIQISNRQGAGLVGLLLAVAGFASVLLAVKAGRSAESLRPELTRRSWLIALALLLSVQAAYGGLQMRKARIIDIGTTTLDAGAVMAMGGNPYRAEIDRQAPALIASGPADLDPGHADPDRFAGYKYLPVMAAAYMPLGLPFGARGLILTNLVLTALLLAGIHRLLREAGSEEGASWAVLFFASLPLPMFQLYAKGVTDLVPVIPALFALPLTARRPGVAGVLLGLSVAAKLMPALLLLPLFLPAGASARWRYLFGGMAGLLPVLPYILDAPQAFADNVLIFNLVRPVDPTSWLHGQPDWLRHLAQAGFGISWLATVILFQVRPAGLLTRCAAACLAILGLLLAGPAIHQNYMLWWLPFFAVLVGQGGALAQPEPADSSFRARPDSAGIPRYRRKSEPNRRV